MGSFLVYLASAGLVALIWIVVVYLILIAISEVFDIYNWDDFKRRFKK